MPRSKSPSVPSYRLHKPSGRAVVRLNERDYYLGPHGTEQSRAAYERLIAEWISHGRQMPPNYRPVHVQPTGLTVNELFVAYWRHANEYYRKNGQPTGEQHNVKDAVRLLIELYGDTAVGEFGPCSLKAVRQRMIDSDLCRAVINARIHRIRRMFKWGVENEMVDAMGHPATISARRGGPSANLQPQSPGDKR